MGFGKHPLLLNLLCHHDGTDDRNVKAQIIGEELTLNRAQVPKNRKESEKRHFRSFGFGFFSFFSFSFVTFQFLSYSLSLSLSFSLFSFLFILFPFFLPFLLSLTAVHWASLLCIMFILLLIALLSSFFFFSVTFRVAWGCC